MHDDKNVVFMCEITSEDSKRVYSYASVRPMEFEVILRYEDEINDAPRTFHGVLDSDWLTHPAGTPIEWNADRRFCIVRPG